MSLDHGSVTGAVFVSLDHGSVTGAVFVSLDHGSVTGAVFVSLDHGADLRRCGAAAAAHLCGQHLLVALRRLPTGPVGGVSHRRQC